MRKLVYIGTLALIVICLYACNDKKHINDAVVECVDTIEVSTIKVCDSLSYVAGAEVCNITAQVEFVYPKFYLSNEKTNELQGLYTMSVLDIQADSISLATAFPMFVEYLMNSYKEVNSLYDVENFEGDYELAKTCDVDVIITICYNRGSLLSVCKKESVMINGASPQVRHIYSTYNLAEMKRVTFAELVGEDNVVSVIELLKAKLRSDRNVKSDEELVDMGFYNIDNFGGNDNFYVTSDSVVWNYLLRELSVFEDVKISLSREDIGL